MNNLIKPSLFLCALLMVGHAFAFAGGVDGGGGVGVRCATEGGARGQLELLDLYEARQRGRTVTYAPASLDEAAALFSQLLGGLDYLPMGPGLSMAQYEAMLKAKVLPNFNLLGQPSALIDNLQVVDHLPVANDVGDYQLQTGCQLEQIAYYSDVVNTLFIAKNWQELDWLNRAALLAHEYSYLNDREPALEFYGHGGNPTSAHTRYFVGELFSSAGVIAHSQGVPAQGVVLCNEGGDLLGTLSYFFVAADGKLHVVFGNIDEYHSDYQMTAAFPDINPKNLLGNDASVIDSSANLTFTGELNAPPFTLHLTKKSGGFPVLSVKRSDSGQASLGQESLICRTL